MEVLLNNKDFGGKKLRGCYSFMSMVLIYKLVEYLEVY